MVHCPNCGTPIEPGGKFCPSCGTKAVEATSTPAPSPTEPRPAAGSPHMPAPKAREATRPKAPSAPSRPSSSGAVGSARSTGSPSSSAPVALFPYDVERNRRYFVPPSIKTEIIVIIVAVIVLFTGFSMGGREAILTAFAYQDVFGSVGAFSSASFGDNVISASSYVPDLTLDGEKFDYVQVTCGNLDTLAGVSSNLKAKLEAIGLQVAYSTPLGMHSPTVWRTALNDFVKNIFTP